MAPLLGAMKRKEAEEIIACLPRGRTLFYYFKDRYALMLLADLVQEGMPVREVKASRYGRLLARPVVKRLVGRLGDGVLTRESDESHWPARPECYLLSLGTWGRDRCRRHCGWCQTSRPGVNLVLQLNFSNKHNHPYQRLIDPSADYHTFETGNRLKQISGSRRPPRSLYTALPRRFCFQETDARPGFLLPGKSARSRSARVPSRFYVLN
jgi:hypothetical protein